jgi:hypothetical protein
VLIQTVRFGTTDETGHGEPSLFSTMLFFTVKIWMEFLSPFQFIAARHMENVCFKDQVWINPMSIMPYEIYGFSSGEGVAVNSICKMAEKIPGVLVVLP